MVLDAHYQVQLQLFSCGKSLKKACELGIKYVNLAILTNPKYGKGHGPINHLSSIEIKKNLDNEKYSSSWFSMGR